jgi:four helix bundle protein
VEGGGWRVRRIGWKVEGAGDTSMAKLNSFRDLGVYQDLRKLHLVVHEESLRFPKFEMYELGSQVRRSSNSAPAIIAEGWGSRHTNIYMEAINRSKGEVRETQHHLDIAHAKGYLDKPRWTELDAAYEVCDRMLERLHERLSEWQGTTRTGREVREERGIYSPNLRHDEYEVLSRLTQEVMSEFEGTPPPSTLHLPPSTLHPPPSADSQ